MHGQVTQKVFTPSGSTQLSYLRRQRIGEDNNLQWRPRNDGLQNLLADAFVGGYYRIVPTDHGLCCEPVDLQL